MNRFFLSILLVIINTTLKAQAPWQISVENPNPENYHGITIANGMLGLLTSPEPLHSANVILGGAYDRFGRGNVSNYIDNIRFMDIEISMNGQRVTREKLAHHTQRLNMQEACFEEELAVNDQAVINARQYALRQLPFCALTVLTVKPQTDITLSLKNCHNLPNTLNYVGTRYREMHKKRGNICMLSTDVKSPTGKLDITAASSFIFPDKNLPDIKHDSSGVAFTIRLSKGRVYRIGIVGSILSSVHHPDPMNETERLTVFATLEGIDRLVNNHKAQWAKLWNSTIDFDGDPQALQDIHSMLYHMYSFVREGSRLSISPMGLSGTGYNGHIFWDADIWMYPALLLLHPELARSLIDYRIDRLESARRNAFLRGYRGAMYPWESSDSGLEETPVFAITGPFEHHITGCVALATWNYFRVTQDTAWLKTQAYPLLKETAEFWLSRIEKDADGSCHIRNVVCADEYATNVDDNAFTNAIASTNLRIAEQAAKILGQKEDPQWTAVAQRLPILQMENGVTREHASYLGEPIKQADVNLLAYPLEIIKGKEQIERDIEYYAQRIPEKNTPAMTEAIFALLYARTGNGQMARRYFKRAYEQNLCLPFRVLAECKGGNNPYFATGAGGILQAVIMGFGGYTITDQGVRRVSAALPTGWKNLKISISSQVHVASQ